MITVKESHFIFKQELNKLNSNFGKAFNPYEIDLLLNNAQMLILAEKTNNKQGEGVEFDNVIMNQLAPILIHKESVIPTANKIKASDLLNKPYKYISYIANITKNDCTKNMEEDKFEKHVYNILITQKSSFKWSICKAYISNVSNEKGIIFEPDGTINYVLLSYYKYPSVVSIGGYVDINNVTKSTVEWTFIDDDIVLEIIKKAALLALESIQPSVESKNFVENLHH